MIKVHDVYDGGATSTHTHTHTQQYNKVMAKDEATGPKIIHDKNSVNFRKNEIHTVQATDKGKFFIYKIHKLFNYKIDIYTHTHSNIIIPGYSLLFHLIISCV